MILTDEKYKRNFEKTFELIDLVFNLKEAYLKKQHPELSQDEIEKKIYNDILKRKKINGNFK